MKKLSTVIISTVLAMAAGQAAAQTAAHAAVQGTMQGIAQGAGQVVAAVTAAATAPAAAQPPRPSVVKDFAAARSFELERSKFHLGAIEKFRKCVEGAKVAADLQACQAAYRTALTGNLNTLIKQGKMAAAYEPAPATKPADVAAVAKPEPAPAK